MSFEGRILCKDCNDPFSLRKVENKDGEKEYQCEWCFRGIDSPSVMLKKKIKNEIAFERLTQKDDAGRRIPKQPKKD